MTRTQALMECARWLAACKQDGWPLDSIPALERVWWAWHDEFGALRKPGARAHSGAVGHEQQGTRVSPGTQLQGAQRASGA
jgi:hypothetical protein